MEHTRLIVKRRWQRKAKARTGLRAFLRWVIIVVLAFVGLNVLAGLLGFGTAVSLYAFYAQQLPEPGVISEVVASEFGTTRLYDRSGEVLLYEVIDPLGGDRTWVELQDIPSTLREATVAIEDKTFYTNPGYNTEGIIRAVWNNLTGGEIQGGSSITQQLVKNLLIAPEDRGEVSYDRKLKELILAIRISREYEKDQILEWYLNTNFYGNLAYGAAAASRVYFDKPIEQLTLAESSMLAAIPQSPALNPIDNFDLARERQRVVLDLMVEEGYLTEAEADEAFATPLVIRPPEQRFDLLAPHFSIAARKQLEALVGPDLVFRGGLVVYTTLDYDLFLQSECAARSHVARLAGAPPTAIIPAANGSTCAAAGYLPLIPAEEQNRDHDVTNAAVTIIRPATGEVLAMIGSLDYYDESIDGNFNVAAAERQPGSAIKPFTYLAAFEQGYTPATMTLDVRTAFDIGSNQPYVPENFDRQFHGPQSIRDALANSYNVPAVQVQEWVGTDSVIRIAHASGITTLDRGASNYGLSLTLGGGEVTLIDMTYAYSVLANNGVMAGKPIPENQRRPGFRTLDPVYILRVEDRDGNILWEYGKTNTFDQRAVLQPALAYLINDILSDEDARIPSVGPESALLLDRPAAVKTGTTNDYRDNWTVGHTPQIATGVWVGNTDNTPMTNMPAIVGAAPLWNAIMTYAHRDLPVQIWERPADVIELTVCRPSGMLPTPYCPTQQELFLRGTEPTTYDNVYQPFQINTETGLLATVYTEPELVEEQVFMILPDEAADWVREQEIPQPPTEYDTVNAPDTFGDVAITSPAPFSYVRGALVIRGNARDTNFRSWAVYYGQGINPTEWTKIGEDNFRTAYDADLATWDARELDGLYSLRLSVVRGNNEVREAIIQVTVDNRAPTVQLIAPNEGRQFTMADEFVTIQPLVTDNISMDRVEFYIDDRLIAISTVAPFNERWIITEPGVHTVQIRAFDTAGNTATSDRIRIEVLP